MNRTFSLIMPYSYCIIYDMKSKITFILDKERHDFLKQYAKQNHRSVTQVLVDSIFSLQKKEQKEVKRAQNI